jgi:tetratricopeptide (TPR) repeat protein
MDGIRKHIVTHSTRARVAANVAGFFAAALAMFPSSAVMSAETNWLDVESRIQYGYFTEDTRSLHGVMEILAPAEGEDATRSYYAGLANYRLTQLTAGKDKSRAKEAAEHCVSSLDRALAARKDFADAFALQSACLDVLAGLEAWRTPFASSKSGAQIEKARHLEPKNPRVLLLDAIGQYERPKSTAAEKEQALAEFKTAADAFETERKDTDHVPGWGSAEVYLYLAKCYLDRGSAVEARDALERALLIAPEFAEARRMMAQITSG